MGLVVVEASLVDVVVGIENYLVVCGGESEFECLAGYKYCALWRCCF